MNPDDFIFDTKGFMGQLEKLMKNEDGRNEETTKAVKEWIGMASMFLEEHGEGYAYEEMEEWMEGQDALGDIEEPAEEPEPVDEFADNPEVVCVNNLGVEEHFDEGTTYVAQYLDAEFSKVYDRNGELQEVMTDRFKEVREVETPKFKEFNGTEKIKMTGEPMPYRKHFA